MWFALLVFLLVFILILITVNEEDKIYSNKRKSGLKSNLTTEVEWNELIKEEVERHYKQHEE